MYSSGTTAVATSNDTAVSLITIPAGASYNRLVIINEGTVAGFYSIDGGNTWARLPAGVAGTPYRVECLDRSSTSPQVKRIASGSNLASVYASAEWVSYV